MKTVRMDLEDMHGNSRGWHPYAAMGRHCSLSYTECAGFRDRASAEGESDTPSIRDCLLAGGDSRLACSLVP